MKPNPPSEKASSQGPIACTSCDTLNPFGTQSCSMCNFLFVKVKEPPPEPKPEPKPEKKKEPKEKVDSETETKPKEKSEPEVKKEKPPASPSITKSIDCGQCSHTNPPGAVTCEMCNFVLIMTPTKMAAPVVHEDPPPEPKPEPEKKHAKPRKEKARKEVPLDQQIPVGRFPQRIPLTPKPTTNRCPNCQAENEPDAENCAMCQFVLQPAADRPKVKEEPAKPKEKSKPEPAKPEPEPAPEPPKKKDKPSKPRKTRPFIMIIDEDYRSRESLTAFLEGKGVEWISDVGKAEEAVMQTQGLSVEIVLMDLKLSSSISGVDIYKKFRDSPFLDSKLPVIFLSGLSPEETKDKMPKDDAHVGLLPKPIDEEDLWKKILAMTGDTFS